MSEQPSVSGKFSLKGWFFGTWLKKNKTGVKWAIGLLAAYLTALVAKVEPPELNAALVGFVGVASKFGLDLFDFWLAESPE